jgi:hypothetical protein
MYNLNNEIVSKRKLINGEKDPFGKDTVFDDVTLKIIILIKLNHCK